MSVLVRPLAASVLCLALAVPGCKGTDSLKKDDAAKTAAGKGETKAKPSTSAPSDPYAPMTANGGPVLALGAAKLMQEGKPEEALELLPDGGIKIAGRPLATLSTDGKLTGPEGKVVLEVGPGDQVTSSGRPVGLRLTATGGQVTTNGATITMAFEKDGTVSVTPAKEGATKVTHEGCTGPVARSCALLMFGMLVTVGDAGPGPGPEAKAAPAAPPEAPPAAQP